MAIIETDSPEIEKHLQKLVELVGEAGGWVHPQTKIESFDGNLCVKIDGPLPQGRQFIKLPMQALLNTESLNITLKNDEFTIAPDKDTPISKMQLELAEAKLSLYNLTGKAKWYKDNCFWLKISAYPQLLDKILEARGTNQRFEEYKKKVVGGLKGKELDEFVAYGFIKQRVLGHKDVESQQAQRSIMPIIDYLNHHHLGTSFSFSNPDNVQAKGPNILSVAVSQPIVNSQECYAHYTPLDALDSYLSYNFIEEWAPYVRSIPVEFEVEDIGKIVIRGMGNVLNRNKMNAKIADLRIFMPIQVEKEQDGVRTLSHLVIPSVNKASALRRTLGILINNFAKEKMDNRAVLSRVIKAEEVIIGRNIAYYRELKDFAAGLIADKGSSQVLEDIKHIADLQLIKLYKYGTEQPAAAAPSAARSQAAQKAAQAKNA